MAAPHLASSFDLWLGAYFGARDDGNGRTPHRRVSDESHDTFVARAADLDANDAALVAAIRGGDAERFAAWYHDMYTDACRFAFRFVHDSDRASDVVQDVFISIWERRDGWVVSGPLRTYILSAIRRRALNVLRHDRVVAKSAESAVSGSSATPGMGTAQFAPDADAIESTLHTAMRRRIAELPERQRTALALRWEHELSNVEIAHILGIGEAAVSRVLARATAALRETWDKLVE